MAKRWEQFYAVVLLVGSKNIAASLVANEVKRSPAAQLDGVQRLPVIRDQFLEFAFHKPTSG